MSSFGFTHSPFGSSHRSNSGRTGSYAGDHGASIASVAGAAGSAAAAGVAVASATGQAVSRGASPAAQARAAAAARAQHQAVQQYVKKAAKKKSALNQKPRLLDAHGRPHFAPARAVGEDIHHAAQRIQHATIHNIGLTDHQQKAITNLNSHGKVVGPKAIKQIVTYNKSKQQTNAYFKGQQREAQRYFSAGGGAEQLKAVRTVQSIKPTGGIGGIGESVGKTLGSAASKVAETPALGPYISGFLEHKLGQPKITTGDVAAGAALGPTLKGAGRLAVALKAAKPEDRAIISDVVAQTAKRISPKGADVAGKALTRAGATPLIGKRAFAFEAKPLSSAFKSSALGGAAIAATKSSGRHDIANAVAQIGNIDSQDLKKAGGTALHVATHLPAAISYTAQALKDPKVRSETLYGLKELGFSAVEFPFLLPYSLSHYGFAGTGKELFAPYGQDVERRWSPILSGPAFGDTKNYEEFLNQVKKPGAGGVAYQITELLPLIRGYDVGLKGAARAGAEVTGLKSLKDFLTRDVKPTQKSAGPPKLAARPVSKGLVGTVQARARAKMGWANYNARIRAAERDMTAGVDTKNRREMPPPMHTDREGMPIGRPPVFDTRRKFFGFGRHRDVTKMVSGQRAITELRERHYVDEMRKIALKRRGNPVFDAFLSLEQGAPKTKEAALAALENRREMLPPGAPEVPTLNAAIAIIEKKGLNKRLMADIEKHNKFSREHQALSDVLSNDLTRPEALTAEALAHRSDSTLKPIAKELGPSPWEKVDKRRAHLEAELKDTKTRIDSLSRQHGRQERRVYARRNVHNEKARRARAHRDELKRRLNAEKAHARSLSSQLRVAKGDLKQVSAGRTSMRRNWVDDREEYVNKVGRDKIRAESERLGMGQPTYFPGRKRPIGEAMVPQETTSRGQLAMTSTGVRYSKGTRARMGERDIQGIRAAEEQHLVAETDFRARLVTKALDAGEAPGLTLDFDQMREGRRTTHHDKSIDELTGEQLADELLELGLIPERWRVVKETWPNRIAKVFTEARVGQEPGNLFRAMSETLEGSSVRADMLEKSEKVPKGSKLIPDDESQLLNEYAGMGPKAQHDGIWRRFKTFTSKALLFNPGWLVWQLYAPIFLAGIGRPSIVAGARDALEWRKALPPSLREAFDENIGVSPGSLQEGLDASRIIAGGRAAARLHDNWEEFTHGRSFTDFFFSRVPIAEHKIRTAWLKDLVDRETWKRMDGHIGKVGKFFQTIDKRLIAAEKRGEYAKVQAEILQDRPMMASLAREMTEWVGDYAAFNKSERALSQGILFYGFMRHSMMLALYTLPVKHPARLALFAAMGKVAAEEEKDQLVDRTRLDFIDMATHNFHDANGNLMSEEDAAFLASKLYVRTPQEAQASRRWVAKQIVAYSKARGGPIPMERALKLAKQAVTLMTKIPMEDMGRVYLPNGMVIDTVRASPLGNQLLQSESLSQLATLAPGGNIAAGILFKKDPFTGADISFTPKGNVDKAGNSIITPLDYLKGGLAMGAGYISPLRIASQAVSKYPASQRTIGSFPLPFLPGGGPLPEQARQYKEIASYQYQLLKRQAQVQKTGGWRSLEAATLPILPHPQSATFANMIYGLKNLDGVSSTVRTLTSERKSKFTARYEERHPPGSVILPSNKRDTTGGIVLPSDEKKGAAPGAGALPSDKQAYARQQARQARRPTLTDLGGSGLFSQLENNLGVLLGRRWFTGKKGGAGEAKTNTRAGATPQGPNLVKAFFAGLNNALGYHDGNINANHGYVKAPDHTPGPNPQQKGAPTPMAKKVIARYGKLGPTARETATAAVKYGQENHIPPSVLMSIAQVDTNFKSPSDRNPDNVVRATAMLLKAKGYRDSPSDALHAYRPNGNYVQRVFKGADQFAKLDKVSPRALEGTTPQAKEIKKRLTKAVARAGTIKGPLTSDQKRFALSLARHSNLSPRVAAAAVLYEGGHGGTDQNWLNIGWTDSGPAGITHAKEWATPEAAGKATADWIKGEFGQQYNYVASPGIQSISQQKGDKAVMDAWANSGWASSGASPAKTYSQVQGKIKPLPKGLVAQAKKVLGKKATDKIIQGPATAYQLQANELFYDPGINLKDGQPTSPVGGHSDHVHFASADPKSLLIAARIAQSYGATVSENPAYGGVEPVHVSDSYHYRSEKLPGKLKPLERKAGAKGKTIGQAIDISGVDSDTLAKINQALAERAGSTVSASGGTTTGATAAGGTTLLGGSVPTPSTGGGAQPTAQTAVTQSGASPLQALSQLRQGGGLGLALPGMGGSGGRSGGLGGLSAGLPGLGATVAGVTPTAGAPSLEQLQAIASTIGSERKKLLSGR